MTTVLEDRSAPAVERCGEAQVGSRELELGAIIDAYNRVTDKLKGSHDALTDEIRRLHARLAEKDRELERRRRLSALGEMAAGVAHEVRNPLGGILLYATLLEKELRDEPKRRRAAERIASAARTLESVVGDILAFANPQAPRRDPVRIEDVARNVVALLRPRWEKLGCAVDVDASPRPPVVHGEADQIQRVLLNLISNAIDAAGRGGHVWVTMRDTAGDDSVVISIADDGGGVPLELRDRIFNPFFTTKDSGTGLGLAIVHGIVEAHGGSIRVSERGGGGALFDLSFPRHIDRTDGTREAG